MSTGHCCDTWKVAAAEVSPRTLAAYIAIGAGIGLSASTAKYLPDLLILSCAASFVCLAHQHWPAIVKFIPYIAGTRQRKSQ